MSNIPQHSRAFKIRRFLNWFPMGLTYAFLYMGRYNLTVSKNALGDLMTKEDFGVIFGVGTITYAFSFLLNGPLTDKIGGKRALLIGAMGSGIVNGVMGFYISSLVGGTVSGDTSHLRLTFSALYALNMYFQSYGAVAIVKVNAHWFHVRERGGFSGIFGTMISSGIFFAFTVNSWVLDFMAGDGGSKVAASKWVFFAPSVLLLGMFVLELFLLKDRPGLAGQHDFDTGDASSGEDGQAVPVLQLMKRILTNPIILTVAAIEFCTGVLRNGVMHWYPIYAKEVLVLPGHHVMRHGSWSAWYLVAGFFAVALISFALAARSKGPLKGYLFVAGGLVFLAPFLEAGWGGILFVAGVIGANVAGWVSDLFFQSRRAPTAGFLYLGCGAAAIAMLFTLGGTTNEVGWSDIKPAPGFDVLQKGDRVLRIAGSDKVEDWSDVTRAVACRPARCQKPAVWDLDRCMCSTTPKEAAGADLQTSDGSIAATVLRGGQQVQLKLQDKHAHMRAGDKRKLQAGPVLTLSPLWLGLAVFFISLCVIGTHGLLSGTATMDFGGRKGAATAAGMIDGFVYLGTGLQSFSLGYLTTRVGWQAWPIFLLPFAVVGFVLLLRIWKVVPKGSGAH